MLTNKSTKSNVDALVCKNTILFSNKSCQPRLSVNFIGNF